MLSALQALQQWLEGTAASPPFRMRPALVCGIAVVALAAFAYAPLFGGGLIVTGDTLHVWRVFEMGRCLDDGQVPCRWAPDLGNGYGLPLFNYYPPLPYYVGDLLHRAGLSYLRAVDTLFILGLVGAGLAMFLLARRLWGDLGGLVSAIAYVYAPYLALDVYLRGALTELWALALAPALLWALYELITTGRARFVPLVALFAALLLLSHNLVVVIIAPAAALWVAALLVMEGRRAWRPALLGVAAAAWGFGLAAFFTLPVLTEGGQVQLDTIAETVDREELLYPSNFVTVSDLFLQRTADYGLLLGGGEATPVQIGWFHWGLAGLSLPAALLLLRAGRRRAALAAFLFCVFFGIGVFMTVSRSHFIWDSFNSLRFLQFPWRYVGLTSLAAAALAGAWLGPLRSRPAWAQLGLATALVGVFVGTGQFFFEPLHRCDVSDAAVLPDGRPANTSDPVCDALLKDAKQGLRRDYLPAAVEYISEPPTAPAVVAEGRGRIVGSASGTDWLDLDFEVERTVAVVASVFDYPNWRVYVDEERVDHVAGIVHGQIVFGVPPGTHRVELRLEDTGVRRLGNLLSLASWAALGLAGLAMLAAPWLARWRVRVPLLQSADSLDAGPRHQLRNDREEDDRHQGRNVNHADAGDDLAQRLEDGLSNRV